MVDAEEVLSGVLAKFDKMSCLQYGEQQCDGWRLEEARSNWLRGSGRWSPQQTRGSGNVPRCPTF